MGKAMMCIQMLQLLNSGKVYKISELAGLEWKDIDYENKTMTIQRSVQDITGFGIITKEPKTENSKRTISMPDKLIEYLH